MRYLKSTELMALAMSSFFLLAPNSFAQDKQRPFQSKIQTPQTKSELITKEAEVKAGSASTKTEAEHGSETHPSAPAPRELRKHGFGVGLGQTFLMGDYGKHGEDKITADLFYSYAASYSFDLLVNAHYSKHEDSSESMRLLSLNSSVKSRLFEFDNFSPFILGGLGFYNPKAHRVVGGVKKYSHDKTVFGANAGAGVDLRLNSQYVVGLLGQLHWPFTSQQSGQPDLKGYYFKMLITLTYLF